MGSSNTVDIGYMQVLQDGSYYGFHTLRTFGAIFTLANDSLFKSIVSQALHFSLMLWNFFNFARKFCLYEKVY